MSVQFYTLEMFFNFPKISAGKGKTVKTAIIDSAQFSKKMIKQPNSCCNVHRLVYLVLVHEQDTSKGGCKFEEFFKVTPQKLINEPYNLYRDIAVPLYSMEEYRNVSLQLIINKIVTSDPKLKQSTPGCKATCAERTKTSSLLLKVS